MEVIDDDVDVIQSQKRKTTKTQTAKSQVSLFDYSVENHFRAMDLLHNLCGHPDSRSFDESEIERLASSITFLSEWSYFNYNPRSIYFASEAGFSNSGEACTEIKLSPFSSASVPKCHEERENDFGVLMSTEPRKDFVLYVGGLVWALDWCPRLDQGIISDTNCEFIAVAAHPPDSSYHKLGARLSGRGMIQIWCLLNSTTREDVQAPVGNAKRKSHKYTVAKEENKPKRPRGRPRKNAIDKPVDVADPPGQSTQALVIRVPESTSDLPSLDENIPSTSQNMPGPLDDIKHESQKNAALKEGSKLKKPRGRPRKNVLGKTPRTENPEDPFIEVVALQLPEDTSNVSPVDGDIPNTPVPQNIPYHIDKTKQNSQKKAIPREENEPKMPKGKPRKNEMDKAPDIGDSEGQFIQSLALDLPEDTSNLPPLDENIQNNLAPHIKRMKKQKAVIDEKNMVEKFVDVSSSEEPSFQALAVEFPENMSNISSVGENLLNTPRTLEEMHRKGNVSNEREFVSDLECTISDLRRKSRKKWKVKHDKGQVNIKSPNQNEGEGPSVATANQAENFSRKDETVPEGTVAGDGCLDLGSGDGYFPEDVALPRVVFGLGHDGKVAWDVKWRPVLACESVNKHRLGYLAVVLGNGSIEVWEIPSPQIIKCIYPSRQAEGTDPRFAKLKPVFRCSTLKYGDRQSMPLTMEWSVHSPHDLILAGCHDGVVALWKFSTDCSSEEARPMICFSAETVPIRALSWAPFEGDPESTNVIVTAGHGGLKFWDLRDPFRPLWDANPSQHYVYSLDWVPNPRCIMVSYDDGTLRILILSKAAYDAPVTGESFSGTQQQGLHSYYCSSSAIWSIHVSRLTGMVAYCGADGTVLYFQLTHKAVEKDPLRNRAPHFLCGSLADEESAVAINTDLPSSPHRMKKSATEWANTPRSARSVVSGLNQAKRVRKGVEKKQKSEDQVLALCYGDDDTENTGTDETTKSSESSKGKASKQKAAKNDQALICIDEDGVKTNGKEDVKENAGNEIEVPPSKLVSMYKVRWNMNKGSERWLCYGGAAGIVRCQEIIPPVIDKKLLKR